MQCQPLAWFYVTKQFIEYKRLRNSNPTKYIIYSYCCISGTCRVNEIQVKVILYYYEKISILSVPDGGYPRKSLCVVTLIYMLLLNSDCHQFHQYQQKEQSSLTSNN
jgi:hypothetical protein